MATPPTSVPASPRPLPDDDNVEPAAGAADGEEGDEFPLEDHTKHYAKTLRLTSDQLVRCCCVTLSVDGLTDRFPSLRAGRKRWA